MTMSHLSILPIFSKRPLRHRIVISYEAEAENIYADDILGEVLGKIDIP